MTRYEELVKEIQRRQRLADVQKEFESRQEKRLATHESAHMVSGIMLGLTPIRVSLKPRPLDVFEKIDPNDLELQRNSIISSFCGVIAAPGNGYGDSLQIDKDIAKMEAHGVYYDFYYQDAEDLLQREDVSSALAFMAEELIKKGTLNKIKIEEIVSKYLKI